jgi:hypothetical protein
MMAFMVSSAAARQYEMELRGLTRVYTELVTEVRIYTGAMEYCERRLRRGGYEAHWIDARAALSKKLLTARRKADRAGVDPRDGRDITREALKLHLSEPERDT